MTFGIKPGLALLGVLAWLAAWAETAPAWGAQATCPHVAGRNLLKVLNINLLATETFDRDLRLRRIANFSVKRGVDVILMQEVVGGDLFGTANSARDLRNMLRARGVRYNLRSALEAGLPDLGFVGNAILSRCEVLRHRVHRLLLVDEIDIFGLSVAFPRNVMVTRLRLPGFGRINVYNTHLCAQCSDGELSDQSDSLLDIVREVESRRTRRTPVVIGGDFNINRFTGNGTLARAYGRIVAAGYLDAYARAKRVALNSLCDPTGTPFPDEHCTIGEGVTPLSDSQPGRIDYVFERGFAGVRRGSQVVFNPLVVERLGGAGKTVSDHAGLFIKLNLVK